MAEFDWS